MSRSLNINNSSSVIVSTILLFILLPYLLSGCGLVFVAGAGAGAYSYISGNVSRTYNASYTKTIDACLKVLNRMEMTVIKNSGDALKTSIESRRYDDIKVTVEIEQLGRRLSQVNVRTGIMGVNNVTDSEYIHENIFDELQKPKKPVKNISAESYKTKTSADDKKPVTSTIQKSTTSKHEQNNIEAKSKTVPFEKNQTLKQPRNPLYIFYDGKETEIPDSALTQLNTIVTFLNYHPSSTIDIKSYTDSHGKAEENLELSWKRAGVFKDYLIEHGVSYERISAKGFGASNFLESNRTETLRRMNRRTVLTIH